MTSVTTDRRFGVNGALAFKAPVKLATTANITLSGEQTIDGTLTSETDVLVKDQTTTTENGIYTTSSAAWTRRADANGNRDLVKGTLIQVTDGSANAGRIYKLVGTNPITPGTSAITFTVSLTASMSTLSYQQAGTGAVLRDAQSKMREWFSAKDFGALGDGATNDTAALIAWAAAMPSGGVAYLPPGTYMVDSATVNGVLFSGKSNFALLGYGATIKVLSGESVAGNHEVLFFSSCTDGVIAGLTVDGNRAGRTPAAVGAHNISISTSCARLSFVDVTSKNAVCDGWFVYTTTESVQASYPTDITLERCVADNAYRNGLSVIGSIRFKAYGGRFINSTGTAPQSGVDVEPDSTTTYGNTDTLFEGVEFTGNVGYGIQSGGVTTGANSRFTIRGCSGSSNTQGWANMSSGTDVLVEACRIGPHSACTRSILDFGSLITNPVVKGVHFDAITAGASKVLIYIHASVAGRPKIHGVSNGSSTSVILSVNKGSDITTIDSVGCTADAIVVGAGVRTVLRDIDITTCTGRGIYTAAADTEIDGATLVDCASATASVQVDTGATGTITENVDIVQTSAIPGGAVGFYWNEVPRRMRNCTARSAGTDYTSTTIATFASGVVGAKIFDCVPHPLLVNAGWAPGGIAAGSMNGTNFTVTGAELGSRDVAFAAPPVSLTNLSMSAFVSSSNVVRVNLTNNTTGTITPSSGNWNVWVDKR